MMGINRGMFSGMGGYGGGGWAGGKYENFRGNNFQGNQPQGFGGFGGGINVAPSPGSGLGFTNWKPPQTGGELPPYDPSSVNAGQMPQQPMPPTMGPIGDRGNEAGGGVPFGRGNEGYGMPQPQQPMNPMNPMRPRNNPFQSGLLGGNPYQNPWR